MLILEGSIIKDGCGYTYKIEKSLGIGGFGSVFSARRDDGSRFAVKTIRADVFTKGSLLSFKR